MHKEFEISEIGMRLIQAYEADQDIKDISSTIALVNERVYAAMTQSQFDALCSLAYSIGKDAFIDSDVRHAFNQGHVIKAATAFDQWSLSEVDGNTYVVDALVRRRTAEKALFLRPTYRTVPTPKQHLKPLQDASLKHPGNDHNLADNDFVMNDSHQEMLELTQEMSDGISPIANAAAEVSQRLDALIEDNANEVELDVPESLIASEKEVRETDNVLPFKTKEKLEEPVQTLTAEDFGNSEAASGYGVNISFDKNQENSNNVWAYISLIVVGLTLAGVGLWANFTESLISLGPNNTFITLAAVMIGTLFLVVGLYYLAKYMFRSD